MALRCSVLQCVAHSRMKIISLSCVAVRCGVWQCIAVCCTFMDEDHSTLILARLMYEENHTHICEFVYIHLCIFMCVCVCVCMCVCMCVYMCTYDVIAPFLSPPPPHPHIPFSPSFAVFQASPPLSLLISLMVFYSTHTS